MDRSWLFPADVIEFSNLSLRVSEKLEKQSLQPPCGRPWILLVRHSFTNSGMLGLLCHVIVVNLGTPPAPSVVTQQRS